MELSIYSDVSYPQHLAEAWQASKGWNPIEVRNEYEALRRQSGIIDCWQVALSFFLLATFVVLAGFYAMMEGYLALGLVMYADLFVLMFGWLAAQKISYKQAEAKRRLVSKFDLALVILEVDLGVVSENRRALSELGPDGLRARAQAQLQGLPDQVYNRLCKVYLFWKLIPGCPEAAA